MTLQSMSRSHALVYTLLMVAKTTQAGNESSRCDAPDGTISVEGRSAAI